MEQGAKVCGVRLRCQAPQVQVQLQANGGTGTGREDDSDQHPKATRAAITIKRESSDEEFKEYAETAMNELLGWYGYANNNNNKKAHRRPQHSNGNGNGNGGGGGGEENDKTELLQQAASGHSSGSESPKSADICGWCGKAVDDATGLASNDAVFCSELCFSQSRRANFKKNKTCDWCKHVRHTVSYVDFQDGASQLQFCSDKCLNQYKMHIFCRETRAHLEMHPHLLTEDTTSGLITPDLWMRNCRSPSSRASSPGLGLALGAHAHQPRTVDEPQTSPLPLITVAHPSKLLSIAAPLMHDKNVPHSRRKRLRKRPNLAQMAQAQAQAQDLRVRRQAPTPFTETSSNANTREFPELASRLCASNGANVNANGNNGNNGNNVNNMRPIRFNGGSNGAQTPSLTPASTPMSNAGAVPGAFGLHHLPPAPPASSLGFPRSLLPPVTMMVPYPVILPVPIPIPIPLPITAFLQAANLRNRMQQNGGANQNGRVDVQPEANPAKVHSDDEEIVVDDDSRLNLHPTNEITHNNGNGNGNSNDCSLAETRDDQFEHQFVPIRLRKRKPADNNPDVRISHTPNVNYKHKKPLSV